MLCDNIINSVPIGLTNLEIARYLYIKLCSMVCFNTTIHNTDSNNFYRLYNMKIDPKTFDDSQVNCYTWSQLYSFLLNYFNIKNKIVKYWHSYVIFYIDNVKLVADSSFGVYSDMSRIHYGDETNFFGPCIYQDSCIESNVVSFNDVSINFFNKVDYKIGYLDKILRVKEFKKKLIDIRDNYINIISKLNFLFSNVGCLSFGYYESKEFIFELEKYFLSYKDFSNIGAVDLVRNNSIDSTDIVQCIYVKYNGFVFIVDKSQKSSYNNITNN